MKRLLAAVGLLAATLFLTAAPLVHADVNDFTVTSFTADDTLSTADPQGELHIVEHIKVNFTDQNHGILRAIPEKYKGHRLLLHVNSVRSDSGAPAQYTTYEQNDNKVFKIGDANRTVTGAQEYIVDYTVRNVMTFYNDHDELFWDVNGDQWAEPFEHVQVTLHLPENVKQSRSPICYAGAFGDTRQDACSVDVRGQTITAQTTAPLQTYQTLSLVAGFDKGVFHPARWYETLAEYAPDIVGFILAVSILALPLFLLWFRHGRSVKGKGVIVPEYSPPKGLGPLEVGTLVDMSTDNKDITAAIIDLAIRRYITIIEDKERRLLRDRTVYTLRMDNRDFSKLNEFEIKLLADIFAGGEVGTEVDLALLKYKLSDTSRVLRTTVKQSLQHRGYVNPSVFTLQRVGRGAVLFMVYLAMLFAASLLHNNGFYYGNFPGFALAVLFIFLIARGSRTQLGADTKDAIEGLKMYLNVAEKDRIRKLQSPDAPYAPKSPEPKHTVELFEKLLPYAMILSVEEQWAKKFEGIYKTPPDWYSGNWTAFSLVYFTSSLASGIGSQVNSAFAAPSSSSGSGFGGGGAGGGGGGGGGGGW